jgi:AbrB family looped-hinge helix DNA binding protein
MYSVSKPLSKLTSQGQISIPAEIRKKLGVGPGSIIEWQETDGTFTIRKATRYSSLDVHHALFGTETVPKTPVHVKKAIAAYIKRKHARD